MSNEQEDYDAWCRWILRVHGWTEVPIIPDYSGWVPPSGVGVYSKKSALKIAGILPPEDPPLETTS